MCSERRSRNDGDDLFCAVASCSVSIRRVWIKWLNAGYLVPRIVHPLASSTLFLSAPKIDYFTCHCLRRLHLDA